MKKINKKGFTLTELLATIVILSVVITIAVPAVIGVSNMIKQNMYESKVKLILQNAKLYGEDQNVTSETRIKVSDLCGKYITRDDGLESGCLKNPKDNNLMDSCEIVLTNPNGRVVASWPYSGDGAETKDGCN